MWTIRIIKDNITVQMEIYYFLYYVAAEDFPLLFLRSVNQVLFYGA